ncbi:hypothetical protein IAQ61_001349 [Plenodomus lingam]|uniref:Uncharacterized protein n=1 Tax=Leptosphaeria maculans (strain JN3 / isolate v23.1.3 / race Av1-4-5-6-7-8) TaxID=985895 RepID=E4ZXT1_LEPMJ|nr:hypothetical protein LEMA_P110950.1 [Plenodomus lingam JN3]KAH9879531.1 hypothetical protein IAQ61_001349 [Plenodomus lingam]CBX96176.1 hypothetical protein LEMA_P110950.1 [Plenodomus lingam JN3]
MDPNATSSFLTDGDTHYGSFEHSTTSIIVVYFILMPLLPLMYWITRSILNDHAYDRDYEQQLSDDCKALWRTNDWKVFYGLLLQTFQVESKHHPFNPWYLNTVQKRWNDESRGDAIRGLLERGIIPLVIHDGGLETTQARTWSWLERFPWVQLPVYRQAMSRAYIEFAVPNCDEKKQREFIHLIENNDRDLQVSLMINRPRQKDRPTVFKATANPQICKEWQPLMMGAESAVEAFLPFMPDTVIKRYAEVMQLKYFLKDWYYWEHIENKSALKKRLPCLYHAHVAQVRVESKLWTPMQLERFVFNYARAATLDRDYRWHRINRAMYGALKARDIPVHEF